MLLALAISLLAVAGFAIALWRTRIAQAAERVLGLVTEGLSAMTDRDMDDDAKEVAVRRAGFGLILGAGSIAWRLAVALAAAIAPIMLAEWAGLAPAVAVFDMMLRWDWIVGVTVGATLLAMLAKRSFGPATPADAAANRNTTGDKLVHGIAFASPAAMRGAAWVEDRVVSPPLDPAHGERPVFVTSLARAGTTALLNALADLPQLATHRYRDMPFLTAPALWDRLAGGAKRQVERHERAHGDGLQIDLASPEALEEALWTMDWADHYRGPAITQWDPATRKPRAEAFMRDHFAKVVRARRLQGADQATRYCSKNNGNIARLAYLKAAFPDCSIVVPLRTPASHAASLLRQHRNFCAMQATDGFVKRYMRDIGHFDFGLLHKPIAFAGFDAGRFDPQTPDYWLAYWIAAYTHVLDQAANCHFVLQDDLRHNAQHTMIDLTIKLGLATDRQFAGYFRNAPDTTAQDVFSPTLLAEANALYVALAALAHPAVATPATRPVPLPGRRSA